MGVWPRDDGATLRRQETRTGIAAVFDGLEQQGWSPIPLALKSVERRDDDALWLRYVVTPASVTKSHEAER
jgi:hypothetical protein